MATSFGGVTSEGVTRIAPASLQEFQLGKLATPLLAVGASNSYGDVGLLSQGVELDTRFLNKLLAFDETSGVLICQPGVKIRDIQSLFVRRGWMLAVTPGTSNVTVGGAVANDVHGKDHHFAGTFGDHVLEFELMRTSGETLTCSRVENAEMFAATVGGLGLTGVISKVAIQLTEVQGPYWEQETIPFGNIGDFFELSQETEDQGWQAAVSWFDCSTSKSGRGSFVRGNRSARDYFPEIDDRRLNLKTAAIGVPFRPPFNLVSKYSLDTFNHAYYRLQKLSAGRKEVHYKDFYYPLDGISNWNRIYGPKGFFQYQSVIPMESAHSATVEMLDLIRRSRQGSFLGVLKVFGSRESTGLMSFPMRGVTLALDFPNLGGATLDLFASLDSIVSQSGGRLNPSKDARMPSDMMECGFPQLGRYLNSIDPGISSDFKRRTLTHSGRAS